MGACVRRRGRLCHGTMAQWPLQAWGGAYKAERSGTFIFIVVRVCVCDDQLVIVDSIITMLLDQFTVLRSYISHLTLAVCSLLCILGLPLCTQVTRCNSRIHGYNVITHLDCRLGLYWTGLTLLNGFSFLVIFSFLFSRCAVD